MSESWFPTSNIPQKRRKLETLLKKLSKRFEELQSSLNIAKPGEEAISDGEDDVIILSAKKKRKTPEKRSTTKRVKQSRFFLSPKESPATFSEGDTVWFKKSSSSPERKGKVTKHVEPAGLWVKLDSGELYEEIPVNRVTKHIPKDKAAPAASRTKDELDSDDFLRSLEDEINGPPARTCSEEAGAGEPTPESNAIVT